MFATTELHKVPITILSRCQRYELKRLGRQELTDHFNRLAKKEGIQMESEAVEMIVREAGGSVRDGLSLLDQIFSYCGQMVQTADVIEVLGLVNHQLVANLGAALLSGDLATVYTLLDEIYLHGADIKRFSNDLLSWFRALVVCKVSQKPGQFLEVTEDELALLVKTAGSYSLETLSAIFNLLLDGLEKASFSQQPRLALELAFIRAVQFRDVVPVSELIARFDRMLTGTPIDTLPLVVNLSHAPPQAPSVPGTQPVTLPLAAQTFPEPAPAAATKIESQPLPEPVADPTPAEQTVITPELTACAPQAHTEPKPVQSPQQTQSTPESPLLTTSPAEDKPPTQTPTPPGDGKKRIRQNWDAFLKYVRERQPWVAASLQMATSVERKGEELIIHFTDSADCTLLKQKNTINSLAEFVLDFFQENLRIQFEVPGSSACALDPANGSAPLQERRALTNDPLVLTALDIFTGQVGEIRIGSRYRASTPTPVEPSRQEEQTATEE
jgi:DNA polymerase-3 subunit gamma/tau